jgi:hypothetical protein
MTPTPSTALILPPGPGLPPSPQISPAALLGVLRAGVLHGGPAVSVLVTFTLMVTILALYVGLCVAIFLAGA